MTFPSWCLCQTFDSHQKLNALEQAMLRQRIVRECQDARARLWAQVERTVSREIREWRVEA